MYKVLRSYSKKAERKHELTRSSGTTVDTMNGYSGIGIGGGSGGGSGGSGGGGGGGTSVIHNVSSCGIGGGMTDDIRNGQVVPMDRNDRMEAAWASGQAFSESSSYEAREHFERKVQRVKKTRGERDSNRKSKKTKVRTFSL